jgi:hypothetical protein
VGSFPLLYTARGPSPAGAALPCRLARRTGVAPWLPTEDTGLAWGLASNSSSDASEPEDVVCRSGSSRNLAQRTHRTAQTPPLSQGLPKAPFPHTPTRFLVVFEKPNRSSFTFTFYTHTPTHFACCTYGSSSAVPTGRPGGSSEAP